jgi:hypothetical protein
MKNLKYLKIDLVELEDQLLERLANAPDDILSDVQHLKIQQIVSTLH